PRSDRSQIAAFVPAVTLYKAHKPLRPIYGLIRDKSLFVIKWRWIDLPAEACIQGKSWFDVPLILNIGIVLARSRIDRGISSRVIGVGAKIRLVALLDTCWDS